MTCNGPQISNKDLLYPLFIIGDILPSKNISKKRESEKENIQDGKVNNM